MGIAVYGGNTQNGVTRSLPQPAWVGGITVYPCIKYLGILRGNVLAEQAYVPAVAKMMVRAETLATLPLGVE